MKTFRLSRIRTGLAAFFSALAMMPAFSFAATWETGTWTSASPASPVAEADNLARASSTTATVTDNFAAPDLATLSDFTVTQDGSIPTSTSPSGSYALGDNAVVTYSFGASADVTAVNIYTYWGDKGRNGLGISSIDVSADGETWTSLADSSLDHNPDTSRNTGISAQFANSDDSAIASNVKALRICCGTMDNNGTGVVEIEVVGAVSAAATFTVTFYDADGNVLSTLSDVALGADVSSQAPEAPAISGQIFTGWSADLTSVTSDLSVTPTYMAANSVIWSVAAWTNATTVESLLTLDGSSVSVVSNAATALAPSVTTDACVEKLYDGFVRLTTAGGALYAVGDGATLQCDFPYPVDLSSLGFWSYWSDGGRDGIAVDSIAVKRGSTGSYREIAVMVPLAYGTKAVDGNNSSSGRLHATATRANGSPLATHVTSLRITFGVADNSWTGYQEIEAFGEKSSVSTRIMVH